MYISDKEYQEMVSTIRNVNDVVKAATIRIEELKRTKMSIRAVITRKDNMINMLQVVEITNTSDGIVIEVIV